MISRSWIAGLMVAAVFSWGTEVPVVAPTAQREVFAQKASELVVADSSRVAKIVALHRCVRDEILEVKAQFG